VSASEEVAELWLPVVGWEAWYSVSDWGRVMRTAGGSNCTRTERLLKPYRDSSGYPCVRFCRPGVQARYKVHRLVCRAFHGEPPEGRPHVDHINSRRADARAENLQWIIQAANNAAMIERGRAVYVRGRRSAAPSCPRGRACSS